MAGPYANCPALLNEPYNSTTTFSSNEETKVRRAKYEVVVTQCWIVSCKQAPVKRLRVIGYNVRGLYRNRNGNWNANRHNVWNSLSGGRMTWPARLRLIINCVLLIYFFAIFHNISKLSLCSLLISSLFIKIASGNSTFHIVIITQLL